MSDEIKKIVNTEIDKLNRQIKEAKQLLQERHDNKIKQLKAKLDK